MKLRFAPILLSFVAFTCLAHAEQASGPLFGSTADGVFEVTIADQPMDKVTTLSDLDSKNCPQPDCIKPSKTGNPALAKANQP